MKHDRDALMARIREGFAVNWNGIHGYRHWMRVRDNGLMLAKETGADTEIIELFALFHDSKRRNDGFDPGHGKRAAKFIRSLVNDLIFLEKKDLDLLLYACEKHTKGLTKADVTVQTCWDADRLDLGRAGIKPKPRYLCTPAAKDPTVIQNAYLKSLE